MNNNISKIKNDVQDRNSIAWKKLCEYVDKVASENMEEFSPLDALGEELYSQIYTLPETISKLKKVKKIWLYGSKLKRIPPEIGEMESLEYFDPYTSYDLHWMPYEIINCKKLNDSRVSTRALYGNFKTKKPFPNLDNNPVRYQGDNVKCSVCKKEIDYANTNQLWVSLRIGTDILPLLINSCSIACEAKLPEMTHKGGADFKQPTYQQWEKANEPKFINVQPEEKQTKNDSEPKLLKLIRKIWEK